MAREATGPRGLPWLGSLLDYRRDPLALFEGAVREHGAVARLLFLGEPVYVVADPEAIRAILADEVARYPKSKNFGELRLLLGNGLLTNEGESWRRQRRIAQPVFHRHAMAAFASTMQSCIEESVDRIALYARTGAPFDLHAEMLRLTLDVVARTLFGARIAEDAAAFEGALVAAVDTINGRMEAIVSVPPGWPTPANLRFRRARAALDRVVYGLIRRQREAPSGAVGDTLLAMLLAARDDETGASMTDEQLRDEVTTILLAGHETTASALTFTLHLLARHPDVARAVEEEVERVLGLRPPAFETSSTST